MDRKPVSIKGYRLQAVEVLAQMPGRIVDLRILESPQDDS
jgi:hypothetical protein